MAVTSDRNLNPYIQEVTYTMVLDNQGTDGGPYYLTFTGGFLISVTDPTYYDSAVIAFAAALNTLTGGNLLVPTIRKYYKTDSGNNSFSSNSLTIPVD